MSPFTAWLCVAVSGAIYHAGKNLLGIKYGSKDWSDYCSACYWLGIAAVAVHFGWVSR